MPSLLLYAIIIHQNTGISMIYSLIARQKVVLVDYTTHNGNFKEVARNVLDMIDQSKTFGQFANSNYKFLTYINNGLTYLVMVEEKFEIRTAFTFLRKIHETLNEKFDKNIQQSAAEYSLNEFQPVIQQWLQKYGDEKYMDKLTQLKKQLQELEEKYQVQIQARGQ